MAVDWNDPIFGHGLCKNNRMGGVSPHPEYCSINPQDRKWIIIITESEVGMPYSYLFNK